MRIKSDTRTLQTTLEAYHLDHQKYPAWGNGDQGMNRFLKKKSSARNTATFRAYDPELSETGAAGLTSPIAYITDYPIDPYTRRATYGYYSNGETWIIFSPGPDLKYDLNPQSDFGSSITLSTAIIPKTYDPTNGMLSPGDIYRIKLIGDENPNFSVAIGI